MIILRKILLSLNAWAFRFLLFAFVFATATIAAFSNPQTLKSTLVEANSYQNFVDATIQENIKNNEQTSLDFSDPRVQQIINNNFPPADLQKKSEHVIDAFYDWIDGRAPEPVFSVDFTSNIDSLARDLGSYGAVRLSEQPECTTIPESLNPFTATCLPPTLNLANEISKLEGAIKQEGAILPQKTYTEADLPKNDKNLSIAEAYPNAPVWVSWLRLAPWIIGLLTALSGVVLIAYSTIRRRAIRILGMTTFTNGVFLCLSPLFFTYIFPLITDKFNSGFSGGEHGTEALFSEIVSRISILLNTYLIVVGFLVAATGLAIVLLERASRPRFKYARLERRSGVISAEGKRRNNGRFRLDPAKVPLQSSEISTTKKPNKKPNKKYRKLYKKGW